MDALEELVQLCREVAGDDFFDDCWDVTNANRVMSWIDFTTDDPTYLGPQKTYALRYMSAAFYGTALLCRSDDNALIRQATIREAMESGLAGHEGHILVDGIKCFVEA